jgi:hypothetical protein
VRRLPREPPTDRTNARRGRLWRPVPKPRHPAQIWPEGRHRPEDGAIHDVVTVRRRQAADAGCRCTARGSGCEVSISPHWSLVKSGRRLKIMTDPFLLQRLRRTAPLKGMSAPQRRKTVAAAVMLIDDVLTTGSTAEACARTLKRAGRRAFELITWARVVKPSQLMR